MDCLEHAPSQQPPLRASDSTGLGQAQKSYSVGCPGYTNTGRAWNATLKFLLFKIYLFDFMCLSVLPTCMFLPYTVPSTVEARRGTRSPGTGVTESCKLQGGSWETKLGPLKEQKGLLILSHCSRHHL